MESVYTLHTTQQQSINVNTFCSQNHISFLITIFQKAVAEDKLCNTSLHHTTAKTGCLQYYISFLITLFQQAAAVVNVAAFYRTKIRSYNSVLIIIHPQSSWPRMALQDIHSWSTYLLQQKQWPHWHWPTLLIG